MGLATDPNLACPKLGRKAFTYSRDLTGLGAPVSVRRQDRKALATWNPQLLGLILTHSYLPLRPRVTPGAGVTPCLDQSTELRPQHPPTTLQLFAPLSLNFQG